VQRESFLSPLVINFIMCHYLIIFFVADFISKKSKESRFYLYWSLVLFYSTEVGRFLLHVWIVFIFSSLLSVYQLLFLFDRCFIHTRRLFLSLFSLNKFTEWTFIIFCWCRKWLSNTLRYVYSKHEKVIIY
jgi:hypothetical protein